MLGDDETGKRLQNLSRAKNRTILELLCAHRYLASGTGNSNEVIRPALHVDGGAYGAYSQRDAQPGRRTGGPYGDGDFFAFKTGIRYHESIIARRESGNNERAVPVRPCGSLDCIVCAPNLHGRPGNHRAKRVNDGSQ